MSIVKKFFSKKKEEAKFKLSLGPGHKLNSTEPGPSSSSKSKKQKEVYVPPKRKNNDLSEEARAAAAAAMSRIEKKSTSTDFNTSLAAIKAQVRRELEAEKKAKELQQNQQLQPSSDPQLEKQPNDVDSRNLAVSGVYFRCAMISDEILSKKEWRVKIKDFLYEQLDEERGLTSTLIIHNCNTKDKVEPCVETLQKYLENIVNHPDEEKYHKIRMSNRIFCDKVKNIEGAIEFLLAAGFTEQTIDDDLFLVWNINNINGNIEQLNILLDALASAETINLDLDRNIQVLLPSQTRQVDLPSDFYRINPEEIKREQELRISAIESAQILKTKAMREKEELRTANRYRYALIRIRFPNGVYLQGTFNVYEKLSNVYEFVQSCLKDEHLEFILIGPTGIRFTPEDYEKTLFDLRLVPNTILNFGCEQLLHQSNAEGEYIKEEFMMLIQQL